MRAALAAVAALVLSACAPGGPADPAIADPPPAALSAATETLAAANGEPLALSRWLPDPVEGRAPVAAILALHGFGDYGASTFAGPGAAWAARGFAVYAYDQRGFGRNSSRGRWPGATALIDDARAAIAQIRTRRPGLPLILLGHSMGGGVALAAAEGAEIDGLILAAPAVWGGDRLSPLYRLAAWSGAALFPDRRWSGKGVVSIQASDNIEVLRALGRDPLYLRRPSSREFLGLIRLMDQAVTAAPSVAAPVLTLYGEKDEVTPKASVLAAHEAIASEKRLILYDEGWHLLFRDLQAETVWRDAADWIDARVAKQKGS